MSDVQRLVLLGLSLRSCSVLLAAFGERYCVFYINTLSIRRYGIIFGGAMSPFLLIGRRSTSEAIDDIQSDGFREAGADWVEMAPECLFLRSEMLWF